MSLIKENKPLILLILFLSENFSQPIHWTSIDIQRRGAHGVRAIDVVSGPSSLGENLVWGFGISCRTITHGKRMTALIPLIMG